ncbi:MAG: hypothetical protein GX780_04520 [Campylobacteraceae bacterium]|nr:hypothetical protein [Campylobacteraceae bacterium]
MNSYTKNKIKVIVSMLLLALFITMVIIGQRKISYSSLGLMMLGLIGILVLLYMYNRSFTKEKNNKEEK